MLYLQLLQLIFGKVVPFLILGECVFFFQQSLEWSGVTLYFLEWLSFNVDAHALILDLQVLQLLFDMQIGFLLWRKLWVEAFILLAEDEYLLSLLGELILQLFLLLLQALQVVVVHPLQVHALLEEVTPFPSHAALDDLLQLNHLLLLESQKAFYLLYLVEEGNVLAFLLHLLTLQLACLIS